VIRTDAAFEAALGIALLAGVGRFPAPHVVVLAAGALLVATAVFLWVGRIGLRALAFGNLATAAAAVSWLALASGFSSTGTAVVAATAGALVLLALAELRL
jgi:hypothetical protein